MTASARPRTLDPVRPFAFSQSALEDYKECRRRFQLRYIEGVRWPAPRALPIEEAERLMERGARFHRMAQQALVGVPLERLEEIAADSGDADLVTWWRGFAALLPTLEAARRYVEVGLAAPLGRHRLVARYDLILLEESGRAVIYDWKTSQRRPRPTSLANRLQSRIYPALLALAGNALNGGTPIAPQSIEMVYWFSADPAHPERTVYSPERFEQDLAELQALTGEIERLGAEDFEMTADEQACRFCTFRSLCARGPAGRVSEWEAEFDPAGPDLDLDQIAEIRF